MWQQQQQQQQQVLTARSLHTNMFGTVKGNQ
jgi:hypothetical protein